MSGNRGGTEVVGDSQDNRSLGSSVPAGANLGPLRPPLIYLGSIALGVVVHVVWPARLVPASVSGRCSGNSWPDTANTY